MFKIFLAMTCLWLGPNGLQTHDCTTCKEVYVDKYVRHIMECQIDVQVKGVNCLVLLNDGTEMALPNPNIGDKVTLPETHCYK